MVKRKTRCFKATTFLHSWDSSSWLAQMPGSGLTQLVSLTPDMALWAAMRRMTPPVVLLAHLKTLTVWSPCVDAQYSPSPLKARPPTSRAALQPAWRRLVAPRALAPSRGHRTPSKN